MMKNNLTICLVCAIALWLTIDVFGAKNNSIEARFLEVVVEPTESPKPKTTPPKTSPEDDVTGSTSSVKPSPKAGGTNQSNKVTEAVRTPSTNSNQGDGSRTNGRGSIQTDPSEPARVTETNESPRVKIESAKNDGILNNLWSLVYWLLIGLVGLLLIGGIGFFINRIFKNAKHERAATQEGFRSIGAKQSSLRQDVDQLKTTAELLSKQLSEQRNEITALKSQSQRRDSSPSEQTKTLPTFSPSYSSPAPEFPVSVETYLAKNAGGAAFGKHDPLFGTLKENTDDGAFYLIRDGVLSDDARYAVPRTKQFVTKDDFVYHYSNYYSCANPSGGEVWIKKPSTVRRTTDGWKLDAQGELEIR